MSARVRYALLSLVLTVGSPLLTQSVLAQATAANTEVAVEAGRLKGVEAEGVVAFKGIPFAAPPVGDLRWRAPQPAASWAGVRDASAYGHDCAQLPFPSDAAPIGTPPAEDCLYANVWRPVRAAGKLPVLVWIYGGGFLNGGASPPTYAGTELAKQGILVFSFNYRLGRFGTFAHPALLKADADSGLVANYGYMDQIAALRWVKRNIAAFGGDPANVTIVGESAGGMSVHALVTSPMTKGLFGRAVIQSGGGRAGMMGDNSLAAAERAAIGFAQGKGIDGTGADALARLRALPADAVVDGLNLMAIFAPKPGPRTYTAPVADGRVAVDSGAAYDSGAFAHVPVMVGATSADIGGTTGPMVEGARHMAALLSDAAVPVYYYRFSYVAQSARAQSPDGASHASDIPFFFHTEAVKYGAATSAGDVDMGRIASAYLVNFVKKGDPNGGGLPRWERYSRADDGMLDLSAGGKASFGKDPLGGTLDAVARNVEAGK
jgi:para-nitrobenzyl esterase